MEDKPTDATPTDPQIAALLHSADGDPLSARNHTLLMLGLFAELRTGELHRLRWRDIPRTG